MAREFYSIDAFAAPASTYQLLPFRFIHLDASNELLVNEAGEYAVVASGTARSLIQKQLTPNTELYSTLKAKQFLTDGHSSALLDVLATKYRTKFAFLEGFTKLHIFVVTLRCDHSCQYCQVSRQTADKHSYDMSFETAKKSIDLMMKSPARYLTMELQGGEPLLAMDLLIGA